MPTRKTEIVELATRRLLEETAEAYEQAPVQLRDAILAAARNGERPAAITRAIRHAYTYEYVAQLIRGDKLAHPEMYADHAVAS